MLYFNGNIPVYIHLWSYPFSQMTWPHPYLTSSKWRAKNIKNTPQFIPFIALFVKKLTLHTLMRYNPGRFEAFCGLQNGRNDFKNIRPAVIRIVLKMGSRLRSGSFLYGSGMRVRRRLPMEIQLDEARLGRCELFPTIALCRRAKTYVPIVSSLSS